MDEENTKLESCPFCESKAELVGRSAGNGVTDYCIGCVNSECYLSGGAGKFYINESFASAKWNERPLEKAQITTGTAQRGYSVDVYVLRQQLNAAKAVIKAQSEMIGIMHGGIT